MTQHVRIVNTSNWDQDVRVEQEGYGIHGTFTLKRGEVSKQIPIDRASTTLRIHQCGDGSERHPKTGSPYLGEVEVLASLGETKT